MIIFLPLLSFSCHQPWQFLSNVAFAISLFFKGGFYVQVDKIVNLQVHVCYGKGVSVLWEDSLFWCTLLLVSMQPLSIYGESVYVRHSPTVVNIDFLICLLCRLKARTVSSLCTHTLTSAWHRIHA